MMMSKAALPFACFLYVMKAALLLALVSPVQLVSPFGLTYSSSSRTSTVARNGAPYSAPSHHSSTTTSSILQSVVVRGRRKDPLLCATSTSIEDESDDKEPPFTIRRDDLMRNYNSCSLVFLLLSTILLVMPDRTNAVRLASKFGGAAGYGLAGGTCYILSGATSHDRLASDTYKRLNVGLLGFSMISLFAVPGEAAFHPKFGIALALLTVMSVVKLVSANVAYTGWRRGVDPTSNALALKQMLSEFLRGAKSTLGGIYNTPRKGFVHLLYLQLVFMGGVSALMQGFFNMGYNTSLFPISLQWSAFARLFLVSTMIYSLKDAAERDRLTGTTFVQLNFMVGLWALAVGIGQGTSRFGFSFSRTPMLLCSVPFFYEGIRSQWKKSEKAKRSE